MDSAAQLDGRVTDRLDDGDDGYMLLGLIVAIAVLLLWIGAAASYEAFQIRRDRELEAARRADQYVRAIRLYYKKFGHYPGSVEQLEKSNNIRFLRRRWVDPLTKTTDWRLISVGQNKTTVKSFFGEPLTGLPTGGLGSLAGSQSAGMPGATGSTGPSGAASASGGFGSSAPGGIGAGIGTLGGPSGGLAASPAGSATPTAGAAVGATAAPSTVATPGTGTSGAATGPAGTPGTTSGPTGAGASSPSGSGNGLGGTNGAIMGVGTNAAGNSILEVNEQTNYQDWEFLYDPRLELLKQKQQLNQGLQTNGAGAFGQAPGSSAGTPAGSLPMTPNGIMPGAPNNNGPGVPNGNPPGAPNSGVPGAPDQQNQNQPNQNQPQTNPPAPTTGVPVQQ